MTLAWLLHNIVILAGHGGLNTATFRLSIYFEVSRGAKCVLADWREHEF